MGTGTEEQQLTERIEDRRDNLAQDLDALQDKVSPSAIVQRRKDAARDRLGRAKERVMGSTTTAGDGASGVVGTMTGKAQGAGRGIGDHVEGSPLAAGLVAFGAGLVVSSLLPATAVESSAAQRVADTAKEYGQPAADLAKDAGRDMGENLKQSATEAAQQVKESATDSASTVKDEGQSSADRVRSESAPTQ
jgi:hypothetical protein